MYANMPAIRNSYLDRIPLLLDRFGRGIVIAVVPNEEHALDCFASKEMYGKCKELNNLLRSCSELSDVRGLQKKQVKRGSFEQHGHQDLDCPLYASACVGDCRRVCEHQEVQKAGRKKEHHGMNNYSVLCSRFSSVNGFQQSNWYRGGNMSKNKLPSG
jgi:hypothetical protein